MIDTPGTGIEDLITTQVAEQLLFDLVATPSPSHQENQAVQLLVDWMFSHGYDDAFIDEVGNAVGIIGNGQRQIVLLGHIDTFPGNPPVWTKGRLIYGRGAVDAKGPLCTFAVAASQISVPGDIQLIIIGAVEEEAATSKGARHAVTQYQPEVCIIGEPSQWDRITLGYKGRLLLDWQWQGDIAHSAGHELSAGDHLIQFVQQVQDYVTQFNEKRTSIFQKLDMSIRDIHSSQDGITTTAKTTIGFRLPPGLSPTQLTQDLQSNIGTIRFYGNEQAFVAEKDTVLSRAFRGAIRANGGKPRFVFKTGTSDMNVVGPVWNCPIVAYGPGDSSLDHTPNEHIDLDDYLLAINVLRDTLQRLCNTGKEENHNEQ